jgi:hypothetical protein
MHQPKHRNNQVPTRLQPLQEAPRHRAAPPQLATFTLADAYNLVRRDDLPTGIRR